MMYTFTTKHTFIITRVNLGLLYGNTFHPVVTLGSVGEGRGKWRGRVAPGVFVKLETNHVGLAKDSCFGLAPLAPPY
jgi:hypothetical protein